MLLLRFLLLSAANVGAREMVPATAALREEVERCEHRSC